MAGRWSKLQYAGSSVLGRLFSRKAAGTCRVLPVASPTERFGHHMMEPMKNCRRSAMSTTTGLYFTATGSCESINVGKSSSGCMTLAEAFKKKKARYFTNFGDGSIYCFSNISIDIFSQIAAIAFQKAVKENRFFCFNAKNIILKQEGHHTVVFVSESDIASVGKKTIYTDRVVGPLATLMYSLYNGNSKARAKKYQHKEVLDLLDMSQNCPKWWSTLHDILDHAVFWPVEKKLAAIVSATLMIGPGKSILKHGIPGTAERIRLFSKKDIMKALGNFYQKVYTVVFVDGEYKVSCSVDANCHWKIEFKGAFHSHYPFGSSKERQPVRILKFVRHILVHFPDENFDAYAASLRRNTLAVATIELDRKFSLSLSIFHAFRALSSPKTTDILNVPT